MPVSSRSFLSKQEIKDLIMKTVSYKKTNKSLFDPAVYPYVNALLMIFYAKTFWK